MNYDVKEIITLENYKEYVNEERRRVPTNLVELKDLHPNHIFIFHLGDWYEVYCDDAQVCADVLGLTLHTNPHRDFRMAGFTKNKLREYLDKLVHLGYCVAICEPIKE